MPKVMETPSSDALGLEGDEEGFTLLEVLTAATLMSVAVTMTLAFLTSTQRSEIVVQEANQQLQENRGAMERISRSLRDASFADGLSADNSSIFVAAADDDVTFYSDVNNDGVTEKIRYFLVGSSLKRSVTPADCSASPCSYPTTTTPETVELVGYVRNATPGTCGSAYTGTGPKATFKYYRVDRGTGALTAVPTPTTAIADLVDISFVRVEILVDITPDKAPTCSSLNMSIALRNWRG